MSNLLLESGSRTLLQDGTSALLLEGGASPPVTGLALLPGKGKPSSSVFVTFIGVGTSWLSGAPTFTASGLSGTSVGSATVVSDTIATATITTGSAVGRATITDSTTSAIAYFVVASNKTCPGIFS